MDTEAPASYDDHITKQARLLLYELQQEIRGLVFTPFMTSARMFFTPEDFEELEKERIHNLNLANTLGDVDIYFGWLDRMDHQCLYAIWLVFQTARSPELIRASGHLLIFLQPQKEYFFELMKCFIDNPELINPELVSTYREVIAEWFDIMNMPNQQIQFLIDSYIAYRRSGLKMNPSFTKAKYDLEDQTQSRRSET